MENLMQHDLSPFFLYFNLCKKIKTRNNTSLQKVEEKLSRNEIVEWNKNWDKTDERQKHSWREEKRTATMLLLLWRRGVGSARFGSSVSIFFSKQTSFHPVSFIELGLILWVWVLHGDAAWEDGGHVVPDSFVFGLLFSLLLHFPQLNSCSRKIITGSNQWNLGFIWNDHGIQI